jgi:hypothetical protein
MLIVLFVAKRISISNSKEHHWVVVIACISSSVNSLPSYSFETNKWNINTISEPFLHWPIYTFEYYILVWTLALLFHFLVTAYMAEVFPLSKQWFDLLKDKRNMLGTIGLLMTGHLWEEIGSNLLKQVG